jgi:hypothetical protein
MAINVAGRIRRRRLRRNLASGAAVPDVPATRDHRPQTGAGGRRERRRRSTRLRRQRRHPGRQGLRSGDRTSRIARTGGAEAGFDPLTAETQAWDHKAYYPGAHQLCLRLAGDRQTGRLAGRPSARRRPRSLNASTENLPALLRQVVSGETKLPPDRPILEPAWLDQARSMLNRWPAEHGRYLSRFSQMSARSPSIAPSAATT